MSWNRKEKRLFFDFTICLIIGVIIEIIFQNIYGITNIGVISALYMTLCGIWDLKDLKDKE